MKYLKFFEEYKDFIGRGCYHITSEIDKDWILKVPRCVLDDGKCSTEELNDFSGHIETMKQFPDIFPKVKKLDKYRAAIERLDVKKAQNDLELLYNKIFDRFDFKRNKLLYMLFYSDKSDELLKLLKTKNKYYENIYDIQLKWYKFLIKLKKSDLEQYIIDTGVGVSDYVVIDLHGNNVGIDRKGNIKLIDF